MFSYPFSSANSIHASISNKQSANFSSETPWLIKVDPFVKTGGKAVVRATFLLFCSLTDHSLIVCSVATFPKNSSANTCHVEGNLFASKRPRHHQRELFSPERAAVRSDPLFHDNVRTCI